MLHKDIGLSDRHAIHSWEVADAAALAALVVASTDVGKVAKQLSPLSFYLLTNNTGPVWKQIDFTGLVLSVNGKTGAVDLTSDIRAQMALVDINTQTASYTAVLADAGKYVRMDVATANNFTVPTNASVAFTVGTQLHVKQQGAGATTIVASGGVTINTPKTLALRARHSTVTLIKVGVDTWDLMGDLA